jgi:hypothetical protein
VRYLAEVKECFFRPYVNRPLKWIYWEIDAFDGYHFVRIGMAVRRAILRHGGI